MAALEVSGEVVGVNFATGGIRLLLFPQGEAEVSARVDVTRDGERFDFDPEDAGSQVTHIHSRLGESVNVTTQEERALLLQFGDGYEWL